MGRLCAWHVSCGDGCIAIRPRGRAGRCSVSVATVTEISATSDTSFEDAVQQGVARATKTLRGVKSAWIKEHQVRIEGNRISQWQVNMLITFELED
jgi:flavin-binding protein dodecin